MPNLKYVIFIIILSVFIYNLFTINKIINIYFVYNFVYMNLEIEKIKKKNRLLCVQKNIFVSNAPFILQFNN